MKLFRYPPTEFGLMSGAFVIIKFSINGRFSLHTNFDIDEINLASYDLIIVIYAALFLVRVYVC